MGDDGERGSEARVIENVRDRVLAQHKYVLCCMS